MARFCGINVQTGLLRACPPRHNPSAPLTAIVVPDPAFATAKLHWGYSQSEVVGLALSANNTVGGVANPALIVMPAGLPAAKQVTLYVNISQVRLWLDWIGVEVYT